MFLKQKLSKTAKNTIVKNYGRLKGGRGLGASPPPLNTPLLTSCDDMMGDGDVITWAAADADAAVTP